MAYTLTLILVVVTVVVYAYAQYDTFPLGLDPYCLKKTPEIYGPCKKPRTIWTFDWCALKCVQRTGCFQPGNQEINAFPSKIGCYMWCSRSYE
ncbi:hypothetical protein DPMN_162994 [Dreissena polymorpha]|uniref:Uncharacterized protein n=1 Tax=Dreissena polymorpha TaxID=45954 RepID=A0A9D4EVX8_DREPO|nr:hypothetical protein DPMN_162994 [Dreissena polymorpha]